MGNGGAQHFGMKEATTSIQDSINYLTSTVRFALLVPAEQRSRP